MKCFVIMPFGNVVADPERARRLENIYTQWIKPCVESVGVPRKKGEFIQCHRADKESQPGDIISHVIENLVEADLVIADLSGRNPNVFYELGVRHSVGTGAILIADNIADIPIDLRTQRTIAYKYDPESMVRFREELQRAIEAVVSSPPKSDNPVRTFLYTREIQKIASSPTPPGYDAVKEMLSEMANLRSEFSKHTMEIRGVIETVISSKNVARLTGTTSRSEPVRGGLGSDAVREYNLHQGRERAIDDSVLLRWKYRVHGSLFRL